jgi:WD40 repeat protein
MATLSAHDTRGGLSSVAFSPDGSRAITGDRGMTSAIVWDVSPLAGAEVANLPAVLFHGGAAEFASDGGRLLASAGHGAVGIWDPTTWSMIETFGSGGPRPAAPLDSGQWIRSDEDVERMAVDPDADLVAVVRAAGDGRVEVWDVERGQQLFVVETDDQVPRVAWSPDGELLAVTDGARRRVLVVDRDGQEVASGDFPDAVWIGFVEFSPDGDGLLVTLEPDQVVLWNWRTRTVEHRIDTSAHMAVMSPSGDLVAVKPRWDTDLRNVEVWDPRLAQLVATLEGQSGEVNDVAFSPDGQLAATVSGDGSLRLWEARTGVPVLVLPGHPATATTVSFSPDGRWLASSGAEGVVRVWALDLDELLQVAERSLTRPLTDEECRQFLHTPSCG